jgi:Na+/phosphate symporter
MATVAAPLVICVAGALLFALASNPKLARMGELAFFCGLFWLTYALTGRVLHF